MAEIVITLFDREYAEILKRYNKKSKTLLYLERKTAEGTALPKGHGRIIDESEISSFGWDKLHDHAVVTAPTIIEADKEEDK